MSIKVEGAEALYKQPRLILQKLRDLEDKIRVDLDELEEMVR